MPILLDTHLLLWAATDSARLSQSARAVLDRDDVWFSAASMWEITFKVRLGRPDFTINAEALRRGLLHGGYQELPINGRRALAVARLPEAMHRDPFARACRNFLTRDDPDLADGLGDLPRGFRPGRQHPHHTRG